MAFSRVERVLTKYDWATKHIDNVEAAVEKFRLGHREAVPVKVDDQTGEVVYHVAYVPEIPDDLRLMLGDALHNLRSALDHLACAIVGVLDPGNDCSHTSFPIFDTSEIYRELSRAKLPSLRQPCYEILDRIQPYKDGSGHNLWKLHRLDIVDKHRLLLSIASVPIAVGNTPRNERSAGQATVGSVSHYFHQMLFAGPSPTVMPMKAGDELGRIPVSQYHKKMGYTFDVAINEPGILEGVPASLFLRLVASEILNIINNFGPCL